MKGNVQSCRIDLSLGWSRRTEGGKKREKRMVKILGRKSHAEVSKDDDPNVIRTR
jgi:hypothetical protein